MDPNANLASQEQILSTRSAGILGARLMELRAVMKAWLANGGFEPDWEKAPLARQYFRK
jgi:hypothetical protein